LDFGIWYLASGTWNFSPNQFADYQKGMVKKYILLKKLIGYLFNL
jgi:hypothetical protein